MKPRRSEPEPARTPEPGTLLVNEFVSVRVVPGTRIIRVVRSAERAGSLADIDRAWGSVERVLTPVHRADHGLLMDMRDARGRNDPEFEAAVARYRSRTIRGFHRVAVVVRTIPGQMQVQRHVQDDKLSTVRIFSDPDQAVAWLETGASG